MKDKLTSQMPTLFGDIGTELSSNPSDDHSDCNCQSQRSPLVSLVGRDDLQAYFTEVFNNLIAPMGALYRNDVLSKLVASILGTLVNMADSNIRADSIGDLQELRVCTLGAVKTVVRTDKSTEPLRLGDVNRDSLEVMSRKENIDDRGRATLKSSAEGSPFRSETIFVLPDVGIVYWDASKCTKGLTLHSRGVSLMLDYAQIEGFASKLVDQGSNGGLLKLALLGMTAQQKQDVRLVDAVKSVVSIFPIFGKQPPSLTETAPGHLGIHARPLSNPADVVSI